MKKMNKKGQKENVEVVSQSIQTAREFTNVKDIKDNFLYTIDGFLIGYIRIYPYNLDLL